MSARRPGDVGGAALALRPRPAIDPGVLAAIVLALDERQPRPARPVTAATTTSWRFSGRWWNQPAPLRRERPRPVG